MGRSSNDPMYRVRNVLGCQRLGPLVNGGGTLLIAFKSNNGKLGLREAGFNIRHPNRGSQEVGSQVMRKLFHEGFRGAVDVTAWVGVHGGHRSNVHHVAAASRDHAWKYKPSAVKEPFDVGVDHRFPIFNRHLVSRFKVKGQAGVVHQHINGGKFSGQPGDNGLDLESIAHIQCRRQN